MEEELAPANQGIDDMSFNDLTKRAAAAMTPKPVETSKATAQKIEAEPAGKDAPTKPKTS
ncbi:MAG: hypothetical protein HLUCCA05_14915 [Roseibaca calidilacus]|uniref:Uncharacterized protein n=1 Tax=Roseibaca calidilacus TaxID=1666912 RepID=A0A0P7W443_9RHOB|nr:MAG: hypothetical protein HLUCCA05_14915 [Roseibaca calidilacus]CUX81287.1 hypothetical protein Ga0058931_1670 [Roseibaca calidilacus]